MKIFKRIPILGTLLISMCLTGCIDSFRLAQLAAKENGGSDDEQDGGIISVSVLEKIQEKYNYLNWSYLGDPVTISLDHWDDNGAATEKAIVNSLLAGFTRRYPTIKVKVAYNHDYENTYGNVIFADSCADVFLVPDGAFSNWGATGKLYNIQGLIDSSSILSNLDDVFPTALTRYQLNAAKRAGSGEQLALPKDIGPHVMYYNKDIFDELEIDYPTSERILSMTEATSLWQEIMVKSNNKYYGTVGLNVEGLVWSAGGDFLDAERNAFPTDTEGLKTGYNYIRDAYYKYTNDGLGIMPSSSIVGTKEPLTIFTEKTAATLCGERSQVTALRSASFRWGVAYIPAFDTEHDGIAKADQTKNCYSGSVGYGMFKNMPQSHFEAAWKFLEYVASEEGQEILSSTGYQIPIYKTLALSNDVVQREIENGLPFDEYNVFIQSAQNQPYGLWQYRASITWKNRTYDRYSEDFLHSDPVKREAYPVEKFLSDVKKDIGSYL